MWHRSGRLEAAGPQPPAALPHHGPRPRWCGAAGRSQLRATRRECRPIRSAGYCVCVGAIGCGKARPAPFEAEAANSDELVSLAPSAHTSDLSPVDVLNSRAAHVADVAQLLRSWATVIIGFLRWRGLGSSGHSLLPPGGPVSSRRRREVDSNEQTSAHRCKLGRYLNVEGPQRVGVMCTIGRPLAAHLVSADRLDRDASSALVVVSASACGTTTALC